jgi:CBS-domain-containing membrane protein
MPRTIASLLQRDVPLLRCAEPVREAVRKVVDADLPALPVVDADERYAGIFGEREFITAIFPGYVKSLGYAAFVPKSAEDALEKRQKCSSEPVEQHMNDEHIDVAPDFSDVQLAEIFIHHRVLVIPVVDGGSVCGLVTRTDFFRALAERLG